MNKELDNFLVKRYPEIFQNRYGDMRVTCMCWGFECGDGWFHILNNACSLIEHHIKQVIKDNAEMVKYLAKIQKGEKVYDWVLDKYNKGELVEKPVPKFVAEQVKEKYGTLRFYYSGGDEYIDGIVNMAESMSANTCEVCGAIGHLCGSGWISTRCEDHTEKQYVEIALAIDTEIHVLDFGEFIKVKVTELIDEEELIGEVVIEEKWCEQSESYVKPEEPVRRIRAKYIKNSLYSYWNLIEDVV